jgi:hypothetical protein
VKLLHIGRNPPRLVFREQFGLAADRRPGCGFSDYSSSLLFSASKID